MTPEQLEKRLKKLERRLCCLESQVENQVDPLCTDFLPVVDLLEAPATAYPIGVHDVNGNLIGIANNKEEYAALWNTDPDNIALGTLSPTSQDFVFRIVYTTLGCETQDVQLFGNEAVNFPLLNFNDTVVPSAPYGIFAGDETFLGFAADGPAVAALWNATPAYFAVAEAVPVDGDDTSINLVLKTADPLPDIRALRYWNIGVTTGTPTIYLSADTFVRTASGTMIKSDVGGTLGAVGATSFGTNTTSLGTTAIDLVDSADTFYKVALTTGTNYVFHSETGLWAWCDVFGAFNNNGGYLPPTVKYLAIQSFGTNNTSANLSVNRFTNVATALNNVVTAEYNGALIVPSVSNTRVDLMPNLQHFLYIETAGGASTYQLTTFGISEATHPNLLFLGIRRNNSVARLLAATQAEIAALPEMTKGVDFMGGRFNTSTDVDNCILGLETALAGTTPVAGATINLNQNPARTAASNTAFTNIEALGYNIVP